MMNGVITHHCRAAALILWLCLVALCDPYPSSSENEGREMIYRTQETTDEAALSDHSNIQTNYEEFPRGLSSTTKLLFTPIWTINRSSSSYLRPTSSMTLSSKSRVISNNSPKMDIDSHTHNITKNATLFNNNDKTKDVVLAVNNAGLFSYVKDEQEKLNKEKPTPTISQLNPEPLKIDSKLRLKLDRRYTPREIAEYISSTGDEKGFTQVVAEMVQDGEIMESKDEIILFLEMVQKQLNKLRKGSQRHRIHPSP